MLVGDRDDEMQAVLSLSLELSQVQLTLFDPITGKCNFREVF